MLDLFSRIWPFVFLAIEVVAVSTATIHAVLTKRETRSIVGWVGLVWLAPIVGAIVYWVLGVNRIHRQALKLRIGEAWTHRRGPLALLPPEVEWRNETMAEYPGLVGLARMVGKLTERPLLPGNQVRPLSNGDEAYPEMLAAIDGAERSVALLSYIFDSDRVGKKFLEALVRAQAHGVEVRVLVDDVGSRYSRPNMVRQLRHAGLNAASFLPTRAPKLLTYANLRNHRKLLVVDGRIGFTGGTNIREGHWLALNPAYPVQCLHFRLEGPVVAQMQEMFAIDWAFATQESLSGPLWFSDCPRRGDVWARGVPDGPDEDIDKLPLAMIGALAAATRSVHVVTPYFLPEESLIDALNAASLRGVDVKIVLPAENNIRPVQWASAALYEQLLECGCRIFHTPPPFDHTKLFVIDEAWSLIGSTNWDPRSLRLNFEFNIECYHAGLAAHLAAATEQKIATAREITLDDVRGRSYPVKIRDGLARVFSPYL